MNSTITTIATIRKSIRDAARARVRANGSFGDLRATVAAVAEERLNWADHIVRQSKPAAQRAAAEWGRNALADALSKAGF